MRLPQLEQSVLALATADEIERERANDEKNALPNERKHEEFVNADKRLKTLPGVDKIPMAD